MTIIDKTWLNELPPFVSIDRVAELFDQNPLTVRRWVKDPNHRLRGEKMDNGQYRIPRDDVVSLANDLYGRLEAVHDGDRSPQVHDPEGRDTGDGLDRPGDVWSST